MLDGDVDVGVLGAGAPRAVPADAETVQRPSVRSRIATDVRPNASRTFSSSRGSGSVRVSTVRENEASSAASARACAACCARRAARSTTRATRTATSTIATSVTTFSRSAMVKVYSGGVRKKLSSRPPAQRREQRRAEPADQRRDDGGEEEQHDVGGQPEQVPAEDPDPDGGERQQRRPAPSPAARRVGAGPR